MNTDYKTFDCYKVLDIPWTVAPQEIRQAYLKKSKEHHPDVGGSNEQQIKINTAYTVLSNPLERERHDRYWSNIYMSTSQN
jgi:curved DNA-binding protein CbpA